MVAKILANAPHVHTWSSPNASSSPYYTGLRLKTELLSSNAWVLAFFGSWRDAPAGGET